MTFKVKSFLTEVFVLFVQTLSIAYHVFSKNLTVFYSFLITRFMILTGGISRQLMLQSPANDHQAEDSSETRNDIYNVLINIWMMRQ